MKKKEKDAGLQYVQSFSMNVVKSQGQFQDILTKKYGEKKAEEILKNFDHIGENMGRLKDVETLKKAYSYLHSDYDQSIFITGADEASYIRTICNIIVGCRNEFGKKILDAGCGNGIITCFMAGLFPDHEIIGIDRCAEEIAVAKKLAEELQLKNVTFEVSSIEEYDREQFDTVFAAKVSQENVKEPKGYIFDTFYNIKETYIPALKPYVESLVKLVRPGGKVIPCEIINHDPLFYAEAECFIREGFNPRFALSFEYQHMGSDVPLQVMVFQKRINDDEIVKRNIEKNREEMAGNILFEPYLQDNDSLTARIFFSVAVEQDDLSGSNYIGWNANILLDDTAKELLLGYYVYFAGKRDPVMYSIWSNCKDDTAIFYFGVSPDGENQYWANMDISRKEELEGTIIDGIKQIYQSGVLRKITKLEYKDGAFRETEVSAKEVIGNK